jgi:hypothetical protein
MQPSLGFFSHNASIGYFLTPGISNDLFLNVLSSLESASEEEKGFVLNVIDQ